MLAQLKKYYYIHFRYTGKGCSNCEMNMVEAEKLKKEFPEIEHTKKVTNEFKKMKDKNQRLKEDKMSAEAALKTRQE